MYPLISDQWIQESKALGNGFGLVSEGLETPFDELPSNDDSLIMRYPLVSLFRSCPAKLPSPLTLSVDDTDPRLR